jgi:hypothetical protein
VTCNAWLKQKGRGLKNKGCLGIDRCKEAQGEGKGTVIADLICFVTSSFGRLRSIIGIEGDIGAIILGDFFQY